MKVDELKSFLRRRGLHVTGKKDELVARAFVAIENDVPITQTAEEARIELRNDYEMKLKTIEGSLPDPFNLKDGWIPEEGGVKCWPMTFFPDIYTFLSLRPNELASGDMNDYKASKAYRYYAEGWLSPLNYHEINNSSKYCFLKATCKPSQRVSEAPHKLWVCLEKSNGKILCGHCSCMAGIFQTCNHFVAALFRIEAAVRMGLTNLACTSKPNEWLPNNAVVKPTKIKNLKLPRGDLGRREKKTTELNCSPKKNYKPSEDININFDEIWVGMKGICTEDESIIFTAETKEVIFTDNATKNTKTSHKLTMHSDILSKSITADDYIANFKEKMTESNIIEIEKSTHGQNNNETWYLARKHVITASKAHAVKTRMETAMKSAEQTDFDSVLKKVAGMEVVSDSVLALKYGREMEQEAVSVFVDYYKKFHKQVVIKESWLSICRVIVFVGGGPDRIVTCSCCGVRLLEVKCPFSIQHLSPTEPEAKLPFLKFDNNGKTSLKRNHQYFTQCQVQMAAACAEKSIFFCLDTPRIPHGTDFI